MNEIFTHALIATAPFCLIAAIFVAVSVAFSRWRRWREAWRMRWVSHSLKPSSASPATKRRIEQLNTTASPSPDALGWVVEETEEHDANALKGATDEQPATLPGHGKIILIADDDTVVAFALARRLERLGYTVLRSPDAVHALLGTHRARPDLVILDVNMPAGNGLAVCEMMASDPQYAGIPVIIHSVIADEATKLRCQRLGAHHVEKSPRSWAEIRSLAERLLPANSAAKTPSSADVAPIDNAAAVMPRLNRPRPIAEPVATVAHAPTAKQPAALSSSGSPAPVPAPPASGPARVLCIESPKDRLEMVEQQLSGLGVEVVRTSDLNEGYWTCFTHKPSLIVVHAAATDKNLPSLLNNLAAHPVTRGLPVLWIREGDAEPAASLPATSSVKVLQHPVDWEDMLVEVERFLPAFGRRASDLLADTGNAASESSDVEPPTTVTDDSHPVQSLEKSLTILCVDDDPVIVQAVSLRLGPYGITVKEADNGTSGYLLAAAEMPDLILLDLKMPNGEGNYVLGKLKDNPRTKNIPVIVMTSETSKSTQRQMMSMGADAFVTKPVDWLALYTEIGRCVQLPKKLVLDYNLPEQLTLAQL